MTAPVTATLSDFLLERIAEDEAAAQAERVASDRWWSDPDLASAGVRVWLAEWRPARVLAECEAKRRIVEQSQALSRYGPGRVVAPELRWVLAALALPYADHPDYDEEWRP